MPKDIIQDIVSDDSKSNRPPSRVQKQKEKEDADASVGEHTAPKKNISLKAPPREIKKAPQAVATGPVLTDLHRELPSARQTPPKHAPMEGPKIWHTEKPEFPPLKPRLYTPIQKSASRPIFEREKASLQKPPGRRGLFIFGSILAVLAVFFVLLSTVFSKAIVTITPEEQEIPLVGDFVAYAEPKEGELGFELMTFKNTEEASVAATELEEVERKASGKIIIYNNFNTETQRLIKNTRFESPDGKIYRIESSIVVPGMKKAGEGDAPGSIEATVFADLAGEEYNIEAPVKFTIPGFKGTPRFEGFYAESTGSISGGFSGLVRTPKDEDFEAAKASLLQSLEDNLFKNALGELPDDALLFENASYVEIENIRSDDKDIGNDQITVSAEGVLYGVIFNRSLLSAYIARNALPRYDESPVDVINIEDLAFEPKTDLESKPWEDGRVPFTLNGNAHIVWIIDEEKVKQELTGAPRKSLGERLSSAFENIESAEVTVRPFWRRTFPKNPEDIEVVINIGQK
ncbi:hypothetical protein L0Y41_01355 [bacterium]|nr:hypothetical protein [bacterium]